jgi:histone deacetylase complex regulatory component SIN3
MMGQQQQPAVKFDHATNYVITVITHIAMEPDIYNRFLEILLRIKWSHVE